MCGINGIVKFEEKTVTQEEILRMNEKIKHRGPDHGGVFVDGKVGLGHRRLSILDLSPMGNQPMVYRHKEREVIVVFNGEIYNFGELRDDLEKKGYKFDSTCDTEVLEAAYLEHGFDCVKKFNGMFAFVIYDKQKNIFFGARDRFGKKPLKYYLDERMFVFSSELKAILTQGVERQVDFDAVNDFLTLQYVPAPKTGFRNIFKLPHASYFVFDLQNRKLEIQKYWELDYSKKFQLSETELLVLLEEKMEEAVKKRMVADVEVGAFLSGGVDSSAVVAFASKYKKKLKTFTIKFNEKDFDESLYAKKIAQQYKTDHHEFLVSEDEMKGLIEKLVVQYEEPYADSSQLPTFVLAQKTSSHVKVVLNGDGGDENFGGYDKYQRHLLVPFFQWIPLKKIFAQMILRLAQKTNSFKIYKYFLFFKMLECSSAQRHLNFTHYFDVFYKNNFYKEVYKKRFEQLHCKSFEQILPKDKFSGLDNVLFLDFNTYVPDDLMVKVDIATMANGLESRSPLLDYEFVEFCAKMKASQKIDIWGNRKKIFKKMLGKYLDRDILHRKKSGFAVPIKHWFRGELRNYLEGVIFDEKGLVLEMMKRDKVEELFKSHQNGQDHSRKLWLLLILNLWHKAYFK